MKTLYLDRQKNGAYLTDGNTVYNLGTLNCALGNIIAMLEESFPNPYFKEPQSIVNHILDTLNEKENCQNIWGWSVNGTILFSIYDILDNNEYLELTLQDIEHIRIKYAIDFVYSPMSIIDIDLGMEFKVNQPFHIIYSLLYYYAFYKLKLVKCQHCGRWFATTTRKYKFCPRNSTFDGYTHLNCEQAVRNIMQELRRKKKSIYNSIAVYSMTNFSENPSNNFLNIFDYYIDKVKKHSSIENIKECWDFLENYKKEHGHGKHN